jgi:phage tail-like protein
MVPMLGTPVPLLTRLPAILQEDGFLGRAIPAFDEVIAPVYSTLDNLEAYVRPEYAPADFLAWLAGWVDVEIDEQWSEEQRRRIVADAPMLHRRVGTAGGIRDALQLAAGPAATVEVEESGGTAWSIEPGAPLPGAAEAGIVVTVTLTAGEPADVERRFERLAAGVVPGYLPVHLSVTVAESS